MQGLYTLIQLLSAMCSVGCHYENFDDGVFRREQCYCIKKYPFAILAKTKYQSRRAIPDRESDESEDSWTNPPTQLFDTYEKTH